MDTEKKVLSVPELAKLLGISRIAIFKKIKKGEIKARKIGRNFVIYPRDIAEIWGGFLTKKQKKELNMAVDKTIKEYGETLKLLGRE